MLVKCRKPSGMRLHTVMTWVGTVINVCRLMRMALMSGEEEY